jgi:hypothetical protein
MSYELMTQILEVAARCYLSHTGNLLLDAAIYAAKVAKFYIN